MYLGVYFAFGVGSSGLVVLNTLVCEMRFGRDCPRANLRATDSVDFLFHRGASRAPLICSTTCMSEPACLLECPWRSGPGKHANARHRQASRKLHERMAHAIMRSPMTFFETTPSGRILNRFSRCVPPRAEWPSLADATACRAHGAATTLPLCPIPDAWSSHGPQTLTMH